MPQKKYRDHHELPQATYILFRCSCISLLYWSFCLISYRSYAFYLVKKSSTIIRGTLVGYSTVGATYFEHICDICCSQVRVVESEKDKTGDSVKFLTTTQILAEESIRQVCLYHREACLWLVYVMVCLWSLHKKRLPYI